MHGKQNSIVALPQFILAVIAAENGMNINKFSEHHPGT
jgi:hypothetical protein